MNILRLLLDTSVIIAFCTECKRPFLFQKLVEQHYILLVPSGVAHEIKQSDRTHPVFRDLVNKKVISILPNLDEKEIITFNNKHPYLNQGEIEVILWGLQEKTKGTKYNCVIDDRRARKIVQLYQLSLVGTIGLLEILRERNSISSTEKSAIVQDLKASGFRI